MIIPDNVKTVIALLEKAKYQAYIVGGAVRDSIMGHEPVDYDIATDAAPVDLMNVFKDFSLVTSGIKHGTVGVITDGGVIECTTFRTDGIYSDKRRPDEVTFAKTLREDISRRDFTVNALGFSLKGGIIDYTGGIKDINDKIIRAVGDPDKRFREDALRLIRALRFASVLSFSIEPETQNAIMKLKGTLGTVARERLTAEIQKLVIGKDAGKILFTYRRVIAEIIPDAETITDGQWRIIRKAIKKAPRALRIDVLLHFCNNTGKLVLSNNESYNIKSRKKILSEFENMDKPGLKKLISRYNLELIESAAALGDAFGLAGINIINGYLREIKKNKEPCTVKELALNGNDLLMLGIKPQNIGKVLESLLTEVINGEKNTKINLHKLAKENNKCLD